ncbi:MAG: hypothetical protein ACT4OM_01505 [Actinomycetota bacterium]
MFTQSEVQLLRWTMWAPGLACFFGSIYVCLFFGHRAWRVTRNLGGQPGPASA